MRYSGKEALDLYHRLVLLRLILKAEEKLKNKKLPTVTKLAYVEYFNKILDDIDSYKNPLGFYLFPNDGFQKDLGICRLNMIPASHLLLEVTHLSKRFLINGQVNQAIRGIFFILCELGGFQLLQSHIDSRPDSISNFNPESWKKFYLIIAEILKLNPQLKGTYGICWFYDPKIEEISPRLAYIREMGREFGGKYFYMGSNEHCIADATFKSSTRSRLFQSGEYLPTNYLLIVPRRKLIQAADG